MKHPEIPAALLNTLDRLYEFRLYELVDIPASPPPLIKDDTPLEELLRLLHEKDHLWVSDSRSPALPGGLITWKDILESLMPPRGGYADLRSSRQTSVARGTADCASCYVKHKAVPLCRPDSTLSEMIRTAVKSGEIFVAIVDKDRFLGEAGVSDLAEKLFSLSSPDGKDG